MNVLPFLVLAAENPVDHVVNQSFKTGPLFGIENAWLWSAHAGSLVLAGILTILVLWYAASRIRTGPESQGVDRYVTKGGFAHMIEVICVYLRDTTVRPLLGDRTDKFMPVLWTFFFFILFNNLLGLVPVIDVLHLLVPAWKETHSAPVGATATQNLFVTAALAIISALVINFAGIRNLGLGGYISHLTAGTPAYLWPLMVPIEIMGTIIKPVALALRLFANMTAGHILVAVLFMFAIKGIALLTGETVTGTEVTKNPTAMGVILGGSISLVSIVSAIAIYFLELFVAFLQAFVFMFLTTVFIAQLSHHDDHEHEHHEGHGHEHAHSH